MVQRWYWISKSSSVFWMLLSKLSTRWINFGARNRKLISINQKSKSCGVLSCIQKARTTSFESSWPRKETRRGMSSPRSFRTGRHDRCSLDGTSTWSTAERMAWYLFFFSIFQKLAKTFWFCQTERFSQIYIEIFCCVIFLKICRFCNRPQALQYKFCWTLTCCGSQKNSVKYFDFNLQSFQTWKWLTK